MEASNNYDFIIVGGGTAGLVLANRLSEDSNIRVLLLEAGEDRVSDPRVTTPLLYPTLMGTDTDWDIVTEPQAALHNKTIRLPLGRTLDGSSAVNGQVFLATSKLNIDTWGELGNPGWDWDVLAPYFRKSFTLDLPPPDTRVHGHYHLDHVDPEVNGANGPIRVSFPGDTDNPFPKAWVNTMRGLGHGISGDPFSGNVTGAFTNAASVDSTTRQRSDANTGYLKPVQDRKNLVVITGAHVQRVILNGSFPEVVATGVQYLHNGETKTAHAKREVILSAGTIHSPKILELSGIGDPELLSSLGIPVIVANKYVGENLQDHPMTGLSFEVQDGLKTLDDLLRQDATATESAMKDYAESRSGPLATGGVISYALLGLEDTLPDDLLPHTSELTDEHPLLPAQLKYYTLILQTPSEATATFCGQASQGNFGAEAGSSLLQSGFLPGNYFTIAVYNLQPLSRGSVHIRSVDAFDAVKLDPGYLRHPLDLEMLARHMAYVSTIVSQEPLASLLKPGGRRNASAPVDNSIESMKEYVKKTTLSSWHPTSTCAMLPIELGGVVNSRLVVHGTRNLRVVDASIFPLITRANPMATVYAVAERAADLIKEDFA
ncbi:glucose-methanol-choline oxidoreductase-like protein [Astrocystis sublimbata]|nr:glucose-methanol-choline oxidoreductase-like protein [Astrocystis sublimbata]